MKQNAAKLLKGSIIENNIGERGTLKSLQHGTSGALYWIVDWAGRGLQWETLEYVQSCELMGNFYRGRQ